MVTECTPQSSRRDIFSLYRLVIIIMFLYNNIIAFQYIGIRPVEGLIFNISINDSARVSWNRPSFVSRDVITLLYQVTITNDTDNIVIEYVTIEREYEVSIAILNPCSIYTVNVTAFDDTYTSDSSITQEEYTGGNYIVL